MKTIAHRLRSIVLASSTALLALNVMAAYPEKPIRVVLPYPPGGGGDLMLRTIQPALEKRLGQSIIVDYKTGAAGNIGALDVANAAPDGYTLLMGATNNYVINQFLFPKMGFDPLQVFAPVSIVAEQPYLVMISSKLEARDFDAFARHAKANAGQLIFGSPGAGTVPHMSALMLSEHLDAKMLHVPYRGSQPGLLALVNNEVQLFIASYGIVAGQVSGGKMHPIAVAADKRLEVLPQVPTAAEIGVPPGVLLGNWWAVAAPSGTDAAILQRLAREIRAVVGDPEVRKKLVGQGSVPSADTPEEAGKRMQAEARQWKAIVDKTGVKIDK